MAYPLTFIPLLSVADPLGGILVWGSGGLAGAVLAAALLGMALNALRSSVGHNRRPPSHDSQPADRDFRAAA